MLLMTGLHWHMGNLSASGCMERPFSWHRKDPNPTQQNIRNIQKLLEKAEAPATCQKGIQYQLYLKMSSITSKS